jgi:hypothetical protein
MPCRMEDVEVQLSLWFCLVLIRLKGRVGRKLSTVLVTSCNPQGNTSFLSVLALLLQLRLDLSMNPLPVA